MNQCKWLAGLCFIVFATTSLAESVEAVFQSADRYTVKIESYTLHPFLEDDEGFATGSGFLINRQEGWVLTNRHVVAEGLSEVAVRFKETDYFEARKVYLDPNLDFAILQIPRESIPDTAIEAPLGCEGEMSTGNAVVIYGHPSGLNFTGTRGIVSGRVYAYGNEWIQTDAPLNSGNSGGPLISVKSGEVIGINAAKHSDDDTEGLNFAVPIAHVCKIIELFEDGEDPSPPVLPIIFVNHDRDDPKLEVARSFLEDSSLLLPGDIITGVSPSKEQVTNLDQLYFKLRGLQGSAKLNVIRGSQEITVSIPITPTPNMLESEALTFSGVTIKQLHLYDGAAHNLDQNLFVVGVNSGSAGSWEEIERWETIYTINGKDVSQMSLHELYDVLQPLNNSGESVSFLMRYFTGRRNSLFRYYSLEMEVTDLKIYKQ